MFIIFQRILHLYMHNLSASGLIGSDPTYSLNYQVCRGLKFLKVKYSNVWLPNCRVRWAFCRAASESVWQEDPDRWHQNHGMPTITTMLQAFSPHFSHHPARSSGTLALHRVAVLQHRVSVDGQLVPIQLTSTPSTGSTDPHLGWGVLRVTCWAKGTSAHPRMVVSKLGELYEKFLATSNGALTHLNSTSRSPPFPHTNRDGRLQIRIRQCPVQDIPDVRENVVAPEHQNHAQHWLSGDCGVTVPGDDYTGWWILRLPLRITARWSSSKRSTRLCIKQLQSWTNEWASIHPRHRVQASMQKTSIVYEYPGVRSILPRVQRTLNLQEIQGTGWCSARRISWGGYTSQYKLWRCAGSGLRQVGLQENVDQKRVPCCAEFCCKNFEDIKILIVLNMKE